ncbi:hypothetical protein AT258_21005 [Bacillus wiedmannii]|uniref:hypothetical protein n=1 Tax=Bacillus TaxID=1386 RepID=UPI00077AD2E4|nr:hypothetical protein [Bacillus mobilis]KXY79054.1 hypothetical protein AT258_21005 [Bacillus wiedmannii]
MKTVAKEIKTMEDILKVLEEETDTTCPFEELPYLKQEEVAHKVELLDEIESGNITNVEKAKRWLELIELVDKWAHDESENFVHTLAFAEGTVQIFSTYGEYQDQFDVDFVNGKLLLDGEEMNSIVTLMNMIEFNITLNA